MVDGAPVEEKPFGYFECEREEMISFVPHDIRTVLDVGCGAGGFGRSLRQHYPDARIHGVEIDKKAAQEAAAVYDTVWTGPYPEAVPEGTTFDCIVFNDVLEHMVDPWSALRGARRHLSPGGAVVASIPNVRYLPVLYDLLVKRAWQYRVSGVLDRTHLRFFTKQSIVDLFESAGFEVCTLKGVNPLRRWQARLVSMIPTFADTRFIGFGVQAREER